MIETSGNRDISVVDPRVHVIMDLKTPSSGECAKNRLENIPALAKKDEVKFVIGNEEDYAWAKGMVAQHGLSVVRRGVRVPDDHQVGAAGAT